MSFNILQVIRSEVVTAIQALYKVKCADFVVEVPAIESHGDIATNVALVLTKNLKKEPMQIADEIAEYFSSSDIVRAEVKKPGFINFFFSSKYLLLHLPEHLKKLTSHPPKKEKIALEHTNVNPNKAMHIGHLRNAVLGDVINNVLQRVGYETEVQYYVDDTGVQVADTYVGLQELGIKQEKGEKFDHYCWRVYAAVNERLQSDPALQTKRTHVLHELELSDSKIAQEVRELANRILGEHLATMSELQIAYDLLIWESDILGFEFWEKAFILLKKTNSFTQETNGKNQGCWVLKTGEESSDEQHSPDKVFVKSDGTVTYTGKDVAYHLWKFNKLGKDFLYERWPTTTQKKALTSSDKKGSRSTKYGHADRVYNVIDVRQVYPQSMVKLALKKLGFESEADKLRHVSYGVVKLAGLGQMSGREGRGVKVDDLLKDAIAQVSKQEYRVKSERVGSTITDHDLAIGVIKYFMLRYNPNSEIVFDFKEAAAITGNTGPYLQYAHARAAGILDKAGLKKPPKITTQELTVEESRLLKKLYHWPQILEDVADSLGVNDITTYAFELANIFNSFYEANPVLKAEGAIKLKRLALVYAFKTVLADVLSILGIVAPEKM